MASKAANDNVVIGIDVEGGQQAESELRRVSGALTTLERTSKQSDAGLKSTAKALQSASAGASQAASKISGAAGAVGALGTAVGSANPVLGQMLGLIGTGGSTVGGVAGFGGLAAGAATGGLVVAAGALALAYKFASDETKNLAKATIDATRTLDAQLSSLRELNSELSRKSRIDLGAGDVDEQFAEVKRLEALEQQTRYLREEAKSKALAAQPAGGDAPSFIQERLRKKRESAISEMARLDREAEQIRKDLERARENYRFVFAEDVFQKTSGADIEEEVGGPNPKQKVAPNDNSEASFNSFIASTAGTQSVEESLRSEEGAAIDAWLAKQVDAQGILTDREKEASEERLGIFLSELEKKEKAQEQMSGALRGSLKSMGEQGTEAFVRLAAGQGDATQAILSGIGDTMVAEGSRYLFRGALEIAGGNYAGGGAMLAIGGAEIIAGLGLGAAVSPAGGGASSGAAQRATEPTRIDTGSSGGSTTIHVNMPTVTSPTAEDGARIQRALREAEILGGRAA